MLKKLSADELQRYADRSEGVVDEATADTVNKLRKLITTYARNVKAAIADFNLTRGEKFNLTEQEALITEIVGLLEESGYQELVTEFERSMQRVGRDAMEYFRSEVDPKAALGGTSREILNKMATDFIDELDFQISAKIRRPLSSSIRNAMLNADTRADATRRMTEVINEGGILRRDGKQFTQANIEVLVQEGPRRFQQQVRNEMAAELNMLVYIYAGPLDKVTSPQCRAILTKAPNGAPGMFYKDQITTALHPNLRDDPLVARGHYGCRHTWFPVDEEGAKEIDSSFIPRAGDGEA